MSATIRQEISIITATLSGAAAADSKEIIQLDTTQYVNPTYYFEVVHAGAASNTGTWKLRRNGTTTDDATTVAYTSATVKRERTAAFTPPAGQTEYILHNAADGTRSQSAKSARIIVIDNPTTLTSTETQIEIGMNKTGLTSSVSSPKVVPDTTLTKYWKYTAANWDGTTTFYAEVTYLMASSKSGGTFVLQEDNGSFASWTDKVTIVNAGVATVATRVRSASFTPTDGRNYRIAYFVASSKSAASIFNAKIIVDQVGTGTNYYFDAHSVAPTDPFSNWTSDANAFDGSTATAATSSTSSAVDYLLGGGTNAPGSGSTILDVAARIYADSNTTPFATFSVEIYTDTLAQKIGTVPLITTQTSVQTSPYVLLSDPTGGWDYTKLGTLETKIFATGQTAGSLARIYKVELLVITTALTLLEPQYLLLNTADNNVAGVQSYQTLYDATEWSGVTNTYKHAMDSDNALNAAKIEDTTTTTVLTTSAVTGANQQISSDMASQLVSTDTLDTDVITSTGVIAASRILVGVTVSSAVNISIAQVAGTVTAAGGTQAISANVLANASVTQVAGTVTASGGTQTVSTALNATVAQSAATVTATGGTQALATVNDVSITQIAGVVTAAGGTQTIATVNKVAITQSAATVTATGGTQTIATVNNVSISQTAGIVTAAGGTQVVATTNFVAISQLAATVTATGGTQLAQTNSSIAQVAATVTATGGTQSIATVNIVGITQVAGSVTAAGGTQVITTSNFVAISQLAGTVTATGGTQTLATVNDVAISQLAATVTASGGTQTITAGGTVSITQVAATVTAAGGTQAVSTVNIVAISQTAATVTASGGTQSLATVNDVAISQVAGTVTVSGGTQAVASSQFTTVTQSAASVTATGGTQTVTTVNNGIVAQLAATVTASGGTQAIATVNNVTLSQVAGTVTASGGTQSLTAQIDAAITQLAANVIATGGTQGVSASSGAASVSITQVGATVTATGGLQVITTSTGPLPSSRPPSTILLTDGHVAVRLGANLYLPL